MMHKQKYIKQVNFMHDGWHRGFRADRTGLCVLLVMGMLMLMPVAGYAENQAQEPELLELLHGDMQIDSDVNRSESLTAEHGVIKPVGMKTETPKQPANVPSVEKQGLSISHSDAVPTERSGLSAEHQLWKSRISAAVNESQSSMKTELETIIQQISSIEIGQKEKVKPRAPLIEQLAPAVETLSQSPTVEEAEGSIPPETIVENQVPAGVISKETLALIQSEVQQSKSFENALELAEILYKSKCCKEAAECYQNALNQIQGDTPRSREDKAWIILQIGNCLQHDQPQAALDKYRVVILDYPDSLWAELARGKSELMNWYLQDQPQQRIENAVMPEETESE